MLLLAIFVKKKFFLLQLRCTCMSKVTSIRYLDSDKIMLYVYAQVMNEYNCYFM